MRSSRLRFFIDLKLIELYKVVRILETFLRRTCRTSKVKSKKNSLKVGRGLHMINGSTNHAITWTRKPAAIHVNLSLVYFVFFSHWRVEEWRVQRVEVVDFFPKNFPAAQKISLINLGKGTKSLKNQLAQLFFRLFGFFLCWVTYAS